MHSNLHSVQSTSHLLVSRKRKFPGIHRISKKAGFQGEIPAFFLSHKQTVYCFQLLSTEITLQKENGQTLYKTQLIISKSNALGQDDTAILTALRLKAKSCTFQCIFCNLYINCFNAYTWLIFYFILLQYHMYITLEKYKRIK